MFFASDMNVCIRIRMIIPVNTICIMSISSSIAPRLFHFGNYISESLNKDLARTNITQILIYLNLFIKICSFFCNNS